MAVLYDYAGNAIEIEATDIADNSVTRAKLSSVLRSSLYVTPEMFGAVGDGVTDDTQAVQTAINQGGIVILDKIYRCVSTISINQSNTIIDGVGTIIGDFTSNGSVLSLSPTSENMKDHIRINNITITSSNTGTHNGIYCGHEITTGEGMSDVIISGVKINNVTGNGIHLHGGPYNSSYVRPYFRVENCKIANTLQAGICESRVRSIVKDNWVIGSGLENITVDNGCTGVVVTGNSLFNQSGGVGSIGVDEADGVVISDNHIVCKSAASYSGEYNVSIGCQCNTGDVKNLIVSNNVFTNGVYGVKLGGTYKAGGIFTSNIFNAVGTSQFYDKNINTCVKANNLDDA